MSTLAEQWGSTVKEARMHDAVDEFLLLLAEKASVDWDDSYQTGRDYVLEFHNPRTGIRDSEKMGEILDKFRIRNVVTNDLSPDEKNYLGKIKIELRSLTQHPLFKEMHQQMRDKTYNFRDFERKM